MSHSVDNNVQPADIAGPSAAGDIDRMTKQICSQVRLDMEVALSELSDKLLNEIQKLGHRGAFQSELSIDERFASSGSEVDSGPQSDDTGLTSEQRLALKRITLSTETPTPQPMVHNDAWKAAVVDAHIDKTKSKAVPKALRQVERKMEEAKEQLTIPDTLLSRFVLGWFFICFCLFVIVGNAVWMAYESDQEAGRYGDDELDWHSNVSVLFTLFFIVELLLRIVALQKYFILGVDFWWNMLDVGLVLVSIPELFAYGADVTFMRVLRLAKVSRAFRLIRLVKFVTSLRAILMSLFFTIGTLFWSFVALVLFTFICALCFMQWIAMQRYEGVFYDDMVYFNFRSTWNSMLVLFSMISGGSEWWNLALEFEEAEDWMAKNILMYYIFFTLFGLVNVIIGVFVAAASDASMNDPQLRITKEEADSTKQMKDLINIFREIDKEKKGYFTRQHFQAYFATRKSHFMLQSLGLQLFDTDKILQVIFADEGSEDSKIEMSDFVVAMMRLCGDAKSTELVLMSSRVEKVLANMRKSRRQYELLNLKLDALQNGLRQALGTTTTTTI